MARTGMYSGSGFGMSMGSKEKNTPGNFSEYDTNNIASMSAVTVVGKALSPGEKLTAGKKRKADGKAVIKNARKEIKAERKSNRKSARLAKTQRKGEAATQAGKLQKARRLQKRKQRLLKK